MGVSPAALGALLNNDMENFVAASMPGGIGAQEAAGQRKLTGAANRLPMRGTLEQMYGGEDAVRKKQWEAVGFVFGEPMPERDGRKVFVACTFPAGWSLKPTGHSMWSDVLDDKGRRRAAVFFKAAFYDYNAHTFGLEVRYRLGAIYPETAGPKKPDDRYRYGVLDNADGSMLHLIAEMTEEQFFKTSATMEKSDGWLEKSFPDHANPLAYWD